MLKLTANIKPLLTRLSLLWLLAVFFLSVLVILASLSIDSVDSAQTVPHRINFQGRLTDNNGNILPDGNYNMQLRFFDEPTGGSAIWLESRVNGDRVTVTNGLFNIQLGSVEPLPPAIFATYPLFLEVELPSPTTATGTSPSWTEGPFTPRQRLASAPYTFNADMLDGMDSSELVHLNPSSQQTGSINISGGIVSSNSIQGSSLTATGLTQGSLLFAGIGGQLSQNNGQLFWNNSTQRLGIGTDNPQAKLQVLGDTLLRTTAATAFLIQNGSSDELLRADTDNMIVKIGTSASASLTGTRLLVTSAEATTVLRVGSATDGVEFSASGVPVYRGDARPTRQVTLASEYPGAVLTADGTSNIGQMTAAFCSGSNRLGINTAVCGSDDEHNYYSWTTAEPIPQSYDIYIHYRLPNDFDGLASNSTVNMYGWRTDSTNNAVELSLFQANGTQCGSATNIATGTAAWTETSLNTSGCSFATGDTILFRVRLIADTNDFVRAGTIRFDYRSKF